MQEEDHGILLESIEKFTEGMVNPKHMFKGRHIVQDRYGEKMVLMVAMIVHSFFTTVVNLNYIFVLNVVHIIIMQVWTG